MAGTQRRVFANRENVATAIALFAKGATDSEVAERFGVDRSTVASMRSREGVQSHYARGERVSNVGRRTAPASRLERTNEFRRAMGWAETEGRPSRNPRVMYSSVWLPLAGSSPVSLEDVTGCRWPIGHTPPFTFCNQPIHAGSYCAAHDARSRTTP